MSINLRSSGGNSLYPERIEAPWHTITATSNVNLGGNEITNVSVIHTSDISGLDSADIVPLLEGSTITNLNITNLSNVNSGAIADLVAYDILVENDLSVNGVLRSHQLDTLSGRLDTLSGVVDGLGGGGGETLAQTLALGNDASGLNIINVGKIYVGKSSGTNQVDVSGIITCSNRFAVGDTTSPPGSEMFTVAKTTDANVFLNLRNSLNQYGTFFGTKIGTGDFHAEQLDAKKIRFITTPNTPGNRGDRLVIDESGTIRIPAYTTDGTLSVVSGLITSSSDKRVKKNITYDTDLDGLNIINHLKPARFTYTWEQDTNSHLGFIADDVCEVLPDAVDGKKYPYHFEYSISDDPTDIHKEPVKTLILNEDGTPKMDMSNPRYKSLDTTAIICSLVKAIQQLNTKVDKLTKLVI